MYKIVFVSDNHGDCHILKKIIEDHPDAAAFVHCGDTEERCKFLSYYHAVAGNNDYGLGLPLELELEIAGKKLLVMHGHYFSPWSRQHDMVKTAKNRGCDILATGHTHVYSVFMNDNILYINPGSVRYNRDGSNPSYAVLYIDENGDYDVERINVR